MNLPAPFCAFRVTMLALLLLARATSADVVTLQFRITDEASAPMPCRIQLTDDHGKSFHPPARPYWAGGFVCDGRASLSLSEGRYHYTIERGPEWSVQSGTLHLSLAQPRHLVSGQLHRITHLAGEGWHAGDLHVHRSPDEFPLHLEAEDLSIASLQTWWNATNAWGELIPPHPIKSANGRHFHLLGGEDERGGGAILYHRMNRTIDITQAKREYPSSAAFLREAKEVGGWAEIEKPFWWDTPLWLSTQQMDSVGLAHNHMQRDGVLGNEAWGRARDESLYPGPHGNGLYTQDLYYRVLNAGFRLPPSAGSASGVLANPVGYNRVYVYTGDPIVHWEAWWEKLRRGHCFVTNGPLLRLRANDKLPGEILPLKDGLEITLEGLLDARDTMQSVELVSMGQARPITLPYRFTLKESGWFLVRAITGVEPTFRFASTAPWYVEKGGEPMPPQQKAVRFFLQWAQERRDQLASAITDPGERAATLPHHDAAIAFWQSRLESSQSRKDAQR